MGKYKIAVYAICKNEEKFVERWVDSMKEADEIIVVDTGSSDNTIKELQSRGVKVYSADIKPWRFDTARNIALDYVPKDVDICVSTDLDEVFEGGWREKLENIWRPELTRVLYTFIGSFNIDGTANQVFMKEKIHANKLYKWSKPVHEILEYIGDNREVEAMEHSIVLKHFPDCDKQRGSYLPLLELSVEENPDDDRNMHYLGREYMFQGWYDKAIEILQKHLNMKSALWKEERCASMRFIARCYLAKGDFDSAEDWLKRAINEASHTREPYTELANLYYYQKNWIATYQMVNSALSIKTQLKTYLLESFCWNHTLYFLGAVSCFNLEKYEEALLYIEEAKKLAYDNEEVNQMYELIENKIYTTDKVDLNKVSIIILTYNNLDYSKKCLDSIRKYTRKDSYEIIVVDNMSTDGTREWLAQQKDIKKVFNNENVGFPKGCNIGIKVSESNNDILLLNNDVEVCENWLYNLQIALNDKEVGAVGASTYSDFEGYLNRRDEYFDFNNIDSIKEFAKINNISASKRWEYRNKLVGYCLLIKREAIENVGFLDERFTPGTYEDDDISVRLVQAGYYLRFCYDAYVHHYESKSFKKDNGIYNKLLYDNGEKFKDKWKFDSNDKCEIRYDLVRMIEDAENKQINILHWNCGLAGTLLEIKNQYPNANLYGIEENENYNNVTRGLIKVSNKKSFPLEFNENLFDYIIIGNELENLNEPKEFLKYLREYLKEDGCVIASISNIMHYMVIRNLISGKWNYSEGDFLNRNSKVFFTEDDFIKFIEECGYKNNFIVNWYHINSEEDQKYIDMLCEIGKRKNEDIYKTYQYTINFKK